MSKQRDLVHGELDHVPAPLAMQALTQRFELAAAMDFSSDVDVLNYALTLEYLEATFYQQGNSHSLLSGIAATYLQQVQKDEEAHVTLLTSTINKVGGTPVAKPMVDFGGAFDSQDSFLGSSFTFENVGVGAYLGAAGYLKDKTLLQAAAAIYGVENRHAAVVANLLNKSPDDVYMNGAFEKPLDKATVLADVKPYLVSQMSQMPGGAPNTGGGATSGVEDKGLLGLGGAAIVGGAGLAAYLASQRHSDDADTPGTDQ